MMTVLAAVSAMIVASAMVHYICKPGTRLHLLDHPNERSLHVHAVPRTGGIAILTGIVVATLFFAATIQISVAVAWITAAVVLLATLSFLDDRKGLPVRVRLIGQIASAGLVAGGGLVLPGAGLPGVEWAWPQTLGIPVTILYLVWMVNLYNFMDGMDGLAGGMAVAGFVTFALLGIQGGDTVFVTVNLIIAASAAAFLMANFPPAKIFMGDSGSASLGLLAGCMSIWAERQQLFPLWISILVFSPFIVDATVTLIRRLLRRERVWQAHKSHYYQRLVQSGWGHKKTVLYEYVLMLACGLSALLAQQLNFQGQVALILFWCLVYPLLMIGVHRMEQRTKS
jgi:UDP-N-acetylmuramyl pentapeptide phosphotransferase/UDP-N-acetylglucosamine-1-phosphate transferase